MSSRSTTRMTDEDYYTWSLKRFDTAIQNKLIEAKLPLKKMPDGKWEPITNKEYESRRGTPKQLEAAEKAAALMVRRQHAVDAGATKDYAAPPRAPTGPMSQSAIKESVAKKQSLEDKLQTCKKQLTETSNKYKAELIICENELAKCKQALLICQNQSCQGQSYQELGGSRKSKNYLKKRTKKSKNYLKKRTKKNRKFKNINLIII